MKNLKKLISWILLFTVGYQFFLSSCAQVATPPGGDKDTIPPTIIESYPKNQALNFNDKKISLEFNEYIKTNNLRSELLVTPEIGFYETKVKPTSITLVLDSALKSNTTYTFNFRNGIEDATERNKGVNIKIVFSTSDKIDSLKVSGNVKDLFLNEKIKKAIVGLYPYTDSLRIDKVKPYYFTQTDTNGNYLLENLAGGKYYMAAFTDENANLIFNPSEEIVDFLSEDYIELDTKTPNYDFKLAKSNLDSIKLGKTTSTAKTIQFDFKRPFKTYQILNKDSLGLNFQNIKNNSLMFFKPQDYKNKDTLLAEIKLTDSLNRDTTFHLPIYFRESLEKKAVEKGLFSFNILPGNIRKLNSEDSLQLVFSGPIKEFDPKKLTFYKDSSDYKTYDQKEFKLNDDQTILTIPTKLLPKNKEFWIDFKDNAFISIQGDTTKAGILKLQNEDKDIYGIISGRIANPEKGINYIVQLLNAKSKKIEYQKITDNRFNFNETLPNTYKIRVIEDRNNNGYWDQGNYLKKQKPERLIFHPVDIKLKSYFEITDIIINN